MSKKIKLDKQNFNKHTPEGMELLEKSIKEVGAIESVTIDKEGEVVTGNARQETFEKLGYKPKFITLEKDEYPVIQTDLSGEKRVRAAILANTTAQKNINLDYDLIQSVAVEEFEVDMEEVGVEITQREMEKIKTLETKPFKKTHVLLSFPPDVFFDIQDYLEKIKAIKNVEYEQSSN